MYYCIKLIQATGLTIILIGFFHKFPELMEMTLLAVGAGIFTFGWIIQKCLVKK